jgi:hypothetical protein
VIIQINQWESKYIRDFDIVRTGQISEERLYTKILAMYYDYVNNHNVEPFTLTYGKAKGFCVNANSHVGVIVYDDIVIHINSMVPDLSLGKILYLQSQAEEISSATETRNVIVENLNNEESIAAIDYFVVSLLQSVEEIYANGLITEICREGKKDNKVIGKLDFKTQLSKSPSYNSFYVEKTEPSKNIVINQAIKKALIVASELTQLEWIRSLAAAATDYFFGVGDIEDISKESFPSVSEYTSIRRDDYEKAIRFSKFILFGYDPLEGEGTSNFPEFLLDMNEVFEFYVTVGLKRIFKEGFENKKRFTLGVGPEDIPMDRKYIELDGYYCNNGHKVVLDTKNKYRMVLDREIPDFIAGNPDIYQQYYYASRVNAKNIILVYPSSKKRTAPIGHYQLNFEGNKEVDIYFWALQITATPKENKRSLICLAKFIESL